MEITLDIKSIQYMNLLSFMTGVQALDCFEYNSSLVFVMSPHLMRHALSNNGEKIRQFSSKIRKNVKIVSLPDKADIPNMEKFILSVTYPVKFRKLIMANDELTINASPEIKAKLIGRNSIRLIELNNIVKKYFSVKKILVR